MIFVFTIGDKTDVFKNVSDKVTKFKVAWRKIHQVC